MSSDSPKKRNINHGIERILACFECGAGNGKKERKLSPTEKLVLIYLALRCNPKTPTITIVGADNIAFHTGLSNPSITRAIKGLLKRGLISRRVRDNNPRTSRKTTIEWEEILKLRTNYRAPGSEPVEFPAESVTPSRPAEITARHDKHGLLKMTNEQCWIISNIIEAFPGHPELRHELRHSPSRVALLKVVEDLENQYDANTLSRLFQCIAEDDTAVGMALKKRITGSNNIAPYLNKLVPALVVDYKDRIAAASADDGYEEDEQLAEEDEEMSDTSADSDDDREDEQEEAANKMGEQLAEHEAAAREQASFAALEAPRMEQRERAAKETAALEAEQRETASRRAAEKAAKIAAALHSVSDSQVEVLLAQVKLLFEGHPDLSPGFDRELHLIIRKLAEIHDPATLMFLFSRILEDNGPLGAGIRKQGAKWSLGLGHYFQLTASWLRTYKKIDAKLAAQENKPILLAGNLSNPCDNPARI